MQPVRRARLDDVVKAARAADDKLVSGVIVFDLFEGGNIAAGKKSLAIEVTLQPREPPVITEARRKTTAKPQ